MGITPRVGGIRVNSGIAAWPSDGFFDDVTSNIAGVTAGNSMGDSQLPAAGLRGGSFLDGTGAGIFALDLRHSPAASDTYIGFRCVIPR